MIHQYEIIRDDDLKPSLYSVKEIDRDNKESYSEEDVVNLLNDIYKAKDYVAEHNFVIAFSERNTVLGIYCMSVGDYQSCNVYNRELAMFLALTGAVSFQIYHNHPNDILYPSDEDKGVAASLEYLGKILGVNFKGSYIIGKSGWKCIDDDYYVYNVFTDNCDLVEEDE